MKYTLEQTQRLIEVYTKAKDREAAVASLAEEFGVSKRSIIGKLSIEKVYVKEDYKTKAGYKPIRKTEIIHKFATKYNGDADKLQGLTKVSKLELEYMMELLGVEIHES